MKIINYAATLSADWFWAFRQAADVPSFWRLTHDFLSHRLSRLSGRTLSNRPRRVRLRGGIELNYRANSADIWTLHEVWVEEIYALSPDIRPGIHTDIVIDLGANIGLTSLWLAQRYGCKRILAVEPNPANARIARRNLERNGIASEVFEAAVGQSDGNAVFDSGQGATNGRIVKTGSSGEDQLNLNQHEVKVLSMNTVMRSLHPTDQIGLLKIDIEGGEQSLLAGDLNWLSRVQSIVVEFHPQLVDYPGLLSTLGQCGFRQVHKEFVNENSLEILVR